MQTISSDNIRECITAGRVVEARTRLTMDDDALAAEDREALKAELDRLWRDAEALVDRAEKMESEGRTGEAKELYESVLAFAVDFPGIQSRINRMEDALALTKAVQRRNRRIRQTTETEGKAPRTGKLTLSLVGAGLAIGCAAVLLFVAAPKQQPPVPEKVVSQFPAQTPPPPLPTIPASPPSAEPVPMPAEPPQETAEKPVLSEPTAAPVSNEPAPVPFTVEQAPSPAPRQSETPLQPILANTEQWYTVQPGDSLSLIAERQLCNQDAWKKIYEMNRTTIADPEKLHPGMRLHLRGIESRCPASRSPQQ